MPNTPPIHHRGRSGHAGRATDPVDIVSEILPAVVTILCLICFFFDGALAQSIRGNVKDRTTEAGIGNASVLLLTEAGAVRKMAVTGADGSYSIEAPGPGTYALRVDAPGYNTHNEPPFTALAGRVVELEITLWSYTELAPVVVTAEEETFMPGPLMAFYERVERGRGTFLTREDIERKGSGIFSGLLRNEPGVDVILLRNGRYSIRVKGISQARSCPPQLWVDGVRWGSIDMGEGPDTELFPSDLEGIEVYRPSAVPGEFSGIGTECGVVAVWTKRGSGR